MALPLVRRLDRQRPLGWLSAVGTAGWLFSGLAIAVGIVLLVLLFLRPILLLVLAAAATATIAKPLVDRMVARRVPHAVAALLCCALLIGLVVAATAVVVAVVADQWDQTMATLSTGTDRLANGVAGDLGLHSGHTTAPGRAVTDAVPALLRSLVSGLASGVSATVQFAIGTVFGLYVLFFLLKDATAAHRAVVDLLPLPRPIAYEATNGAARLVRRYFLGLTLIALANTIVVVLGALVLRVPHVPTIAMVTFLTAYVPYVGAFVSGTLAVLIALGSGGAPTAVWMLLVVLLANGSLQNVLQPIAFGAALDLHPLVVLLATAVAGLFAGVAGVALAAPAVAIVANLVSLLRQRAPEPGAAGDGARPPAAG